MESGCGFSGKDSAKADATLSGLKLQWSRVSFSFTASTPSGHVAPSLIHLVNVAICSADNRSPFGGITSSSSLEVTR